MARRANGIEGRVVVVASNHADTLDDCLDGVAEACPAGVDVVVVDLDSDDGSADVAIRHPRTNRVTVIPDGDPGRVLDAALGDTQRIALLRGDRRPTPGWWTAARDAMRCSNVVFGPDRDLMNVAIRLWGLEPATLFTGAENADEVLRRVRLSGGRFGQSDDMAVLPAATSVDRRTSLPDAPIPPASARRWTGLITVILCTRDREQHLKRCLESLARLEDDDHEIIVVDNHPVPTVDPRNLPLNVYVIHEPRAGLDVARNRGVAEASGEVVAFIDDDCEADPHWLTGLRCSFAEPDVALVTGRVRAASLSSAPQRYFESYFTFDRGPLFRRFTPWDRRPSYPLWMGPLGTGCNMAMRRSLLVEVGGFDELLDMGTSVGGGGDLDIFARFIDRGLIVEYTPEALVWHHHRDDMRALEKQFQGYGQTVGALLLKAFLDRPGLRRQAVVHYVWWLRRRELVARHIRHGSHLLPMRLLRKDLVGGLRGPFLYAMARKRARAV